MWVFAAGLVLSPLAIIIVPAPSSVIDPARVTAPIVYSRSEVFFQSGEAIWKKEWDDRLRWAVSAPKFLNVALRGSSVEAVNSAAGASNRYVVACQFTIRPSPDAPPGKY